LNLGWVSIIGVLSKDNNSVNLNISVAKAESKLADACNSTGQPIVVDGQKIYRNDSPNQGTGVIETLSAISGNYCYLIGSTGNDKQQSKNKLDQILSTFKFTDSADETAGWKTYADPNKYFSFQYPPSWTLKNGFDSKTDTAVYDSADMKEWPTNGGSTVSWPAHFLDIFSIEVTSRTAEQEADEYEKSWNVTDAQLNRISVNKNGVDFEFYDLEGENAVRYRNVAISNGKFLIKASSSIDKIGDGSIESQILSTFKFLE
jgi:hypothetical protein